MKLKSYNTNCRTCWKKSDKVLAQIYKDNQIILILIKKWKKIWERKIYFFRNGRSTEQLIKDLEKIIVNPRNYHAEINFQTNLFSDSCDIYSNCVTYKNTNK